MTGEDHLYCPLRVDGSDHIHLCKRANIVPSRGFIQRTVLRGLYGSTDMNICITPRPPPYVSLCSVTKSIRRTTPQKTEEPARSTPTLSNHSKMFSFRIVSIAIAGAMLLVGQAQAAALIATDPGETLQHHHVVRFVVLMSCCYCSLRMRPSQQRWSPPWLKLQILLWSIQQLSCCVRQ